MREVDERYFERLEGQLEEAMAVAESAKQRGGDPEPTVEIPVAKDMADRVENILQIDGVAERVRELETEFSREEAALELAKDFANGTVGDFETKAGKIEGAVRTAVALLTEGVVAAPIEGIDSVEILPNDDGSEFVNVYYAGPIRSAGGTAQALSVLVADYTRALVGLEEYHARDDEIERYAEEVALYDSETGLQYSPTATETKFIASNLPIMLDGEATGDEEVSGFRDLDRVDTNSSRGGMCLVLAEGIALKAPKIQRYTAQLDEVDWPWLQDLIDGTYDTVSSVETDESDDSEETSESSASENRPADDATAPTDSESIDDSGGETDDGVDPIDSSADASEDGQPPAKPAGPIRPSPSKKFLRDLIAGRPVFSHPSADGGFRLRYGRARNHGFATGGVHPATMHLVDDFLATGTQIKTERPGKAHGVVPVDSIEGPTVRLANGDVRRVDDPAEALEIRNGVEKILDLGEYLVNYGEFVENNHPLAPASYVYEWWIQDMATADADTQAIIDDPRIDPERPTAPQAIEWATEYDAPLHPTYTYLWHDLSVAEFCTLAEHVSNGQFEEQGETNENDTDVSAETPLAKTLVLDNTEPVRQALETIVIEHRQRADRIEIEDWEPFVLTLGCTVNEGDGKPRAIGTDGGEGVLSTEESDESFEEEQRKDHRRANDDRSDDGPITLSWSPSELSERARTWGCGDEKGERSEVGSTEKLATKSGVSDERGSRRIDGVDVPGTNAIEAVNEVAPFQVRERAPTRIGNRMGRPEKSERRDLSPAVHTLFPIGEAGGNQRDVAKAGKHADTMSDTPGVVEVTVGRKRCPDCGTETYTNRCPSCDERTDTEYRCPDCDRVVDADEGGSRECPRCERDATCVHRVDIDVNEVYREALERVGERENTFDILKGVKGLTSATKVPEPVEKGVLRAKHDVSTFKDGTVRYDMTDLPVTAVRASELDVTAGQLRALGYETDIHGEALTHDDQLVELNVQDVVLSDGAAEHMMQTAAFIDDLLSQYYGLDPFYELDDRQDLVGELVFGMAPHTSAAVVGRVIGFTSAAVGYAHPFFHAAKRRNCFHPDTTIRYDDHDGTRRVTSVESFVEDRLTDPRADDVGTLVQDIDPTEMMTVPSIDEDGSIVTRPVEAVSKHPAPDHLVRIETRGGRSITVTPDHTMVVHRAVDGERRGIDGGAEKTLSRTPASHLTVGDVIPVPVGETRSASVEVDSESGEPQTERHSDTPVVNASRNRTTVETDGGQSIGFDTGATPSSTTSVAGDVVERIEIVESRVDHVYCLTVSETHTLVANDLFTGQCDGDEDCVMLLLDGLINFSKSYLPSSRGGRMDAPLVMSSRIDPSEIDDEAHNIDVVTQYPREFYEASLAMADPGAVDIEIAEASLGTDEEYTGFDHTHDTTNIAMGPDLSAYKTLGTMMDKMDAQLELARKLRAVDETDVAERVIEYHFLPDLIGNLRAFSRQETRCLDCGVKFRRMPLTEVCRECGGQVTLTVHEGSVTKYLQTAIEVAEEYGCRPYTKQRLDVLKRSIESVFENDKNKPTTIADFMGPGSGSDAD